MVIKLKIDILKKEEVNKLKGLLSIYQFNDYRAYRMLNKGKLKEYLFNQILNLLDDNKSWVIGAYEGERIVGLATLSFLSWDTEHFGIKMGKIGYIMADRDYQKGLAIKDELLAYIFSLCRKEKIIHLSCRIDISDTSSIHTLESSGFRIMDTLVTYAFNRYKHKVPDIKDLYKIREFKKQDLSSLVDIAKNAFSKDRFHLDPNIPREKADDLFGEWIKNSYKGIYADRVFVAEKGTEAIGFLTFRLDRGIEKLTAYKIAGHGLSAVSNKVKGVYPSLAKAAVQDITLHYDCLEFDTQLSNFEVIKIWQRFAFDFIKARYTFHKWLK